MANEKDDFSDLGAVPAEDFSDLGAVAIEPEGISALESAVEGGRQGMTQGFSDEGSGVVGAGLDLGQQLLNKLGLTGPSPSQVSKTLAKQGFKGDLGPQDLLETYRQYRNEDRARMQAAAEANPKSFMAGSVVGGLATTPLMPAALTAPMQAAKGAGLATKMGVGAVNALPTAVAAGAGMSEADLTEGDIAGLSKDVLTGAGIGAGFGAAIPLAGAGIGAIGSGLKAAGSRVPETWKTAFQRGTEGVDVTSPEFYKGTNERLLQVVDETADPILKRIETQKAANKSTVDSLSEEIQRIESKTQQLIKEGKIKEAQLLNERALDLDNQIDMLKRQQAAQVSAGKNIQQQENAQRVIELDNKLNKLKQLQQDAVEAENARVVAQSKADVLAANKRGIEVGKELQGRVNTFIDDLGKEFDKIDEAASAAGVTPDNREVISSMDDAFFAATGDRKQTEALMKRYLPFLGKNDMKAYRELKSRLYNDMRSNDMVVRDAARAGYNKLKGDYESLLEQNLPEVSKRFKDVNRKYFEALDLEDNFLKDVSIDKVTKDQMLEPATIRTLKSFGSDDISAVNRAQEFQKRFTQLDPEGASILLPKMRGYNEAVSAGKSLTPQISENPELARLQQLLAEARGASADVPTLPNPNITRLEQQASQVPKPSTSVTELPNPELTRLQNLLAQAKGETPGVIPGLDVNVQSPKALKDELTRLLPKTGRATGDDIAEKRLQQTMDFLRQEQGPEAVEQLQKKLTPLAEDVELRNLINRAAPEEDIPTSTMGLAKSLSGGAASIANKAGLAKRAISQTRENVQKESQQMLKNGIRRLTGATPQQIDELSARLSTMGNEGASYAKVLRETANKNDQSRSAIIFGLMQQPRFREMLRQANGEGTEDETQ